MTSIRALQSKNTPLSVFWRPFLAVITAFFMISGPALGADYLSPRSAGLGGSGHAGPLLNDAIYLNPSFVSILPTYAIGGNYFMSSGNNYFRSHGFNVSIQDGRSPLFQAGVGFTQFEGLRILSVGASRAVVQKFGFGLGGKFLFPIGDEPSGPQAQNANFSMSWILSDAFQFALMIDNIFESPESNEQQLHREATLGIKVNIQGIVMLYYDPHWVPSLATDAYGHESGIEFTLMSDFFFRLGWFNHAKNPFAGVRASGYGVGIGWVAPRVSFDYGMNKTTLPVSVTTHIVGMTAYY